MASAETIRIATYHTGLERRTPGLFLRDLMREAKDIEFVLERMAAVDADVWVLQDIDYDHGLLALGKLAELSGYPHMLAAAPNSGVATGVDLDNDGFSDGPRDAQGYGWFSGQGGIALLSRYPLTLEEEATSLVWAELPWATLPEGFYSKEALAVQRLSTTAHWRVQVVADPPFDLLTLHATTPAFDGPEDRNGLRNADELRLLESMLPDAPFVVAGNFNLDPQAGDGARDAMADFLSSGRVQNLMPGRHTADYGEDSAGKLRVSYVLPSPEWRVVEVGIDDTPPPSGGDIRFTRHYPVWADLVLEGGG